MDLLKFWLQDVQIPFERAMEDIDLELELTADYTHFVHVDGEEGDYGLVSYFDDAKRLVAIHVIKGGDEDFWEVSEHGKQYLSQKMLECFHKSLQEWKAEPELSIEAMASKHFPVV